MNLSLQKYLKFRLYLKDQMNLKYLLLLEVLVDPIRLKRFLVDLEVLVVPKRLKCFLEDLEVLVDLRFLVDLEGLGVQLLRMFPKFRLYPKDPKILNYLKNLKNLKNR